MILFDLVKIPVLISLGAVLMVIGRSVSLSLRQTAIERSTRLLADTAS